MAQLVQMAGNGIGGVILGNFGNYTAAADGTFNVDSRDAAALLAMGATYVSHTGGTATVATPIAAAAGQIVASAALSNGTLTIANQPDVPRPVALRVDPGTTGITAGVATVAYVGNDNQATTDVIPLNTPASTLLTHFLSKGVVHLSAPVVTALAGGATPHIQLDTKASVSVSVPPGTVDFSVGYEAADGTSETVGALVAGVLGSITPTTAPNGTHSYTFGWAGVTATV